MHPQDVRHHKPPASAVCVRVENVTPLFCTLMSRFNQTCDGPLCTYLSIYLSIYPKAIRTPAGRRGSHREFFFFFCSEKVPVTDALTGRRTHTPAVC